MNDLGLCFLALLGWGLFFGIAYALWLWLGLFAFVPIGIMFLFLAGL